MNWQQFIPLIIVLAVGAIFVWRSSSPKKHEHDCHCDCHEHEPKPEDPAGKPNS